MRRPSDRCHPLEPLLRRTHPIRTDRRRGSGRRRRRRRMDSRAPTFRWAATVGSAHRSRAALDQRQWTPDQPPSDPIRAVGGRGHGLRHRRPVSLGGHLSGGPRPHRWCPPLASVAGECLAAGLFGKRGCRPDRTEWTGDPACVLPEERRLSTRVGLGHRNVGGRCGQRDIHRPRSHGSDHIGLDRKPTDEHPSDQQDRLLSGPKPRGNAHYELSGQ